MTPRKTTPEEIKGPQQELEKRLKYRFSRPELLQLALTHASLAFERGTRPAPSQDNEQLEFLGDAVLGMLVAEALYREFPQSHEGELTRMRAMLVSRKHMGEIGARLHLGDDLLLGRGEERSGGRKKPVLLANAMEAVLAAIYLDGGLSAARRFVEREILRPKMQELTEASQQQGHVAVVGDFKSALQELLQAKEIPEQARYVLAEETGPDHKKHFRIELHVTRDGKDEVLATGEGATKKQAQQRAAEIAYRALAGPTE